MPERDYICTDYWVPIIKDGQESGMLENHSQQSIGTVQAQIVAFLGSVKDADGVSAAGQMEWIRPHHDLCQPQDPSYPFPKGSPFAVMRRGTSEGYCVEVYSKPLYEGTAVLVFTIKYLSNKAFAYQVAQVLNDALDEGLYQHETPPDFVVN